MGEARAVARGVRRRRYFPVRFKFAVAIGVALFWTMFSVWLSGKWIDELGAVTHPLFALFAITFIAFVLFSFEKTVHKSFFVVKCC